MGEGGAVVEHALGAVSVASLTLGAHAQRGLL